MRIPCCLAHPFRGQPHTPKDPRPLVNVPHSGFLTRFAACSDLGLPGLFHPGNAFQLHPTGISPPKEPRRLFVHAMPSCRFSEVALPSPREDGSFGAQHANSPRCSVCALGRLHGLAPLESPLRPSRVLPLLSARAPPGLCPLQGFPRSLRCPGSSPALLPCLARPNSAQLPRPSSIVLHLGVVSRRGQWLYRSLGRLTLLRFLATCSSQFDA